MGQDANEPVTAYVKLIPISAMDVTVSDSATGSEFYHEEQYSNYSSAYYNYTGPYYDYYNGEGYYNHTGYDGYADYDTAYETQQQPDPLREIGYGGLVPGLNYSSVANQSGLYDEASVWSPKDYFLEVVINKCVDKQINTVRLRGIASEVKSYQVV